MRSGQFRTIYYIVILPIPIFRGEWGGGKTFSNSSLWMPYVITMYLEVKWKYNYPTLPNYVKNAHFDRKNLKLNVTGRVRWCLSSTFVFYVEGECAFLAIIAIVKANHCRNFEQKSRGILPVEIRNTASGTKMSYVFAHGCHETPFMLLTASSGSRTRPAWSAGQRWTYWATLATHRKK